MEVLQQILSNSIYIQISEIIHHLHSFKQYDGHDKRLCDEVRQYHIEAVELQ